MESESSIRSVSSDRVALERNRTVFVCGFVPKRWHNSALQAVIQDLLCDYYVACNAETWDENTPTRALLSNAEALLFFVNEFTLADKTCLLNLQYAWHLMVPVIMLRPPRTKLVICKREQTHDDILVVGNGSIVRSPSTRWTLLEDTTVDNVDYGLLQDVLHEGYKLSIIYDRLDHKTSMKKISARLKQVMRPSLQRESEQRPFYLSPCNGPELTERSYNSGEITTERGVSAVEPEHAEPHLRLTQSLNNLKADHPRLPRTPHPHANGTRRRIPAKLLPVQTPSESQEELPAAPQSEATTTSQPPSTISRTSSRERRLSMGSLDDVNSFQETQYLVFPMKNANKKPTLIKFPDDLMEDKDGEQGSIWGSDTSLEEETEIAKKINGGMSLDYDEPDSPIGAPAPYIEDL